MILDHSKLGSCSQNFRSLYNDISSNSIDQGSPSTEFSVAFNHDCAHHGLTCCIMVEIGSHHDKSLHVVHFGNITSVFQLVE